MSYLFFLATYDQNDFVLKPIFPARAARPRTPDEPSDDALDAALRNIALPAGFMSRMTELASTLPDDE